MGRPDHTALLTTAFDRAVAVVTGGASGIGAALAAELAAHGATVVVADLDGERAAGVADGLRGPDGRPAGATAAAVDVTDPAAVSELVERTAADHGRLDLLCNNAGVAVGGDVADVTLAHWHRVVDVNLFGVVHGVAAAYPLMVRQGRGHIVNTASLSGLVASPLLVPYSTTKHAVVGLSTGLRVEAAAHGVRVSVVCPGVIETPLLDSGNPADLPPVAGTPDIRAMLTSLLGAPYPAPALARDVLVGVARNRAVIVAPWKARAVWAAFRLAPQALIDQSPGRIAALRR